jgi:hypothetical protein
LALLNPGTVTQIIGQALIAAGLMDDHRRVVATIHIAEFARGTGNGGDNLREQPLLHFPATGMLVLTRWRTRQCYPLPRKQTEQRNDQMQDMTNTDSLRLKRFGQPVSGTAMVLPVPSVAGWHVIPVKETGAIFFVALAAIPKDTEISGMVGKIRSVGTRDYHLRGFKNVGKKRP